MSTFEFVVGQLKDGRRSFQRAEFESDAQFDAVLNALRDLHIEEVLVVKEHPTVMAGRRAVTTAVVRVTARGHAWLAVLE